MAFQALHALLLETTSPFSLRAALRGAAQRAGPRGGQAAAPELRAAGAREHARRDFKGVPWVFKVVGQAPMVVIYTEETVEDVLKTQFNVFPRGADFRDALRDLFGDGILNVDGANWFHQRKTASYLFTPQMMRDVMEGTITRHTEPLCEIATESARKGDAFGIKHLLDLYATDIFTKIGFGVDLQFLEQGNIEFFERFRRIGNIILSIGVERQQSEDIAWVDKFILNIIVDAISTNAAKPREDETSSKRSGKDLVDLFINSSDTANTPLDPTAIRDMAMSFISGGRDTTAYGMSWFLIQMSKYPHIQSKVRVEIRNKLPGMVNREIVVPTKEQTNALIYLEAVIEETLRLYPVVPIDVRVPLEDVTLVDGTFLKARTKVVMPNYAVACMKSVWEPDAEEFNPDRWIDSVTGTIHTIRTFSPFKFTTFSGGPRICLGHHFSLMEMKITLSSLLAKFEIVTERDPDSYAYDKSLVLSILGPVMVRATPVNSDI